VSPSGIKGDVACLRYETRLQPGLSATPEREDTSENTEDVEISGGSQVDETDSYDTSLTGRELGPIIYDFSLAKALELGIIPHFTINHFGLPLSPEESLTYERLSHEIQKLRDELSGQVPMGKSLYLFARMRAQRSGDLLIPRNLPGS
jgi:superfamily II DNA or RNA helicase